MINVKTDHYIERNEVRKQLGTASGLWKMYVSRIVPWRRRATKAFRRRAVGGRRSKRVEGLVVEEGGGGGVRDGGWVGRGAPEATYSRSSRRKYQKKRSKTLPEENGRLFNFKARQEIHVFGMQGRKVVFFRHQKALWPDRESLRPSLHHATRYIRSWNSVTRGSKAALTDDVENILLASLKPARESHDFTAPWWFSDKVVGLMLHRGAGCDAGGPAGEAYAAAACLALVGGGSSRIIARTRLPGLGSKLWKARSCRLLSHRRWWWRWCLFGRLCLRSCQCHSWCYWCCCFYGLIQMVLNELQCPACLTCSLNIHFFHSPVSPKFRSCAWVSYFGNLLTYRNLWKSKNMKLTS